MCKCADTADEKLAALNAAIDWAFMIDPKTGRTASRPQIKVRKLNPKSRKPLPILSASFCPFCGSEFQRIPLSENDV